MPFREKSAWISLVSLVATFGVFFIVLSHGLMGENGMAQLRWFLHAAIAFLILQVALHLIARVAAPVDARTPVDERERLILLKATRNAYIALVLGAGSVPLSLHLPGHFHLHWPALPWVALGGLFIAEVVRAFSQIVYFRRDR